MLQGSTLVSFPVSTIVRITSCRIPPLVFFIAILRVVCLQSRCLSETSHLCVRVALHLRDRHHLACLCESQVVQRNVASFSMAISGNGDRESSNTFVRLYVEASLLRKAEQIWSPSKRSMLHSIIRPFFFYATLSLIYFLCVWTSFSDCLISLTIFSPRELRKIGRRLYKWNPGRCPSDNFSQVHLLSLGGQHAFKRKQSYSVGHT